MTANQEFAALEALLGAPAAVRTAGLNIIACARNGTKAIKQDLEIVRAYAARQQRVNRYGA